MDVVNFIIMAFVVFLMVKAVNKLTSLGKKKEEPKKEEPKKTTTDELLAAILDELKKQNGEE